MEIKLLTEGQTPSPGFVRRPRPVWPEFATRMTWFTVIEFQANGREGMVYAWVKKNENHEYERGHLRTRFCRTYRGQLRKNLDAQVWA